ESWNAEACEYDWRPPCSSAAHRIAWLKGLDSRGAPVFVPADAAIVGRREAGDQEAVALADSNGAASGASAAVAELAALLELIERDALARWWYGRRARPSIALSTVVAGASNAVELIDWLDARSRRTWLVDITSDLDIPALVAISSEPDGSDVVLGH